MEQWAPYHFLLMLETLRDFRRRNCVLPVGAQQIEGSLMHQEVVAQTPEGRLRAWVESNPWHLTVYTRSASPRDLAKSLVFCPWHIAATENIAHDPTHSDRSTVRVPFFPNVNPRLDE
jgi:hypothetical protein